MILHRGDSRRPTSPTEPFPPKSVNHPMRRALLSTSSPAPDPPRPRSGQPPPAAPAPLIADAIMAHVAANQGRLPSPAAPTTSTSSTSASPPAKARPSAAKRSPTRRVTPMP